MFKKFRNNSLRNCGLCPSHYLSAPALSWDAIFKISKIEQELIPDSDMYMFFEKGTRGGICSRYSKANFSNRYSKANNKYLKSYDPRE